MFPNSFFSLGDILSARSRTDLKTVELMYNVDRKFFHNKKLKNILKLVCDNSEDLSNANIVSKIMPVLP